MTDKEKEKQRYDLILEVFAAIHAQHSSASVALGFLASMGVEKHELTKLAQLQQNREIEAEISAY